MSRFNWSRAAITGRTGAAERYRRIWMRLVSRSTIAAVGLHLIVFLGGPALEIELPSDWPLIATSGSPSLLEFAEVYRVTGRSADIAAKPTLPAPPDVPLDLASLLVVETPRVEERMVFELPAPPVRAPVAERFTGYERMSPIMIPPDIRNRSEVERFLQRGYRRILDRGKPKGTTLLLFWIDELGQPQQVRLETSSGSSELDGLALDLPSIIQFRPARRGKVPIRVIVQVPIRFDFSATGVGMLADG
jgi:TonB family protein